MHRCDYIVENITEYGMFWGLWGMKGVFYMNERRIKLSGTKEVKEFVNTAGLCDFDVDVFYNHFVIDAKSILGEVYKRQVPTSRDGQMSLAHTAQTESS